MSKNTKTAEALRPCTCSRFFAVVVPMDTLDDGTVTEEVTTDTGCSATTRNEFAQGHDAKLKSHLIQWGARGLEVAYVDGGVRVGTDARNVASRFGFGHQVEAGIAALAEKLRRQAERAAAKHDKAAAKATKTEAPVVEELTEAEEAPEAVVEAVSTAREVVAKVETITARVGRWTYEGTLTDGEFTYKAKLGGTKTTKSFTRV